MIDKNANLSLEEIEEKLSELWKNYAHLFNNFKLESDEIIRKKMDDILRNIRALEVVKKSK